MDTNFDIQNIDGLTYLASIQNNSVDLILTDPPYIISKDTGMNKHYNNVKANEENNIVFVKTEKEWKKYKEEYNEKKEEEWKESKDDNNEDWIKYKKENILNDEKHKELYRKYGTIYGKKYCVKTDYGKWDSDFTMEVLEEFITEYYKKLKQGGTLILFFDLWKITPLKELLEKHKFKQIRFIEWIKTNPQPLNSSVNYLTNCREIAILGVKGTKPTFHSKYDNAIYEYPLQGGKNRFHPTQKSLPLFEDLIKKHSNEDDVVLDTFLGSGTTAIACKNTKRKFKGCEVSTEYYEKLITLL